VLSAGARLGPYEILAPLGAGGMGEVYRARDTRLGREAALKVLPESFARDAERMARFEREAQVLAALNHPNIATVHGLEESTEARALVMELVEGPTLADRVAHGPIPIEEALPIARQIAEALEYAHERGIVHRDLKPANVKLTPDGVVKILDFGLAKAVAGDASSSNVNASPTLSLAATQAGIILGTAAYMAPEQARGKPVDRRADIWAFGCVLYEMLAGRRAFDGESVSDILAAVLKTEIDWNALPETTPRSIRAILLRCLDKDARRRLRDIGEARIAIEDAIAQPEAQPSVQAERAAPLWRVLPWCLAGVLATAVLVAFWAPWRQPPRPETLRKLEVSIGADASLMRRPATAVVLSPDGKMLAFVTGELNNPRARASGQLFVRRLDQATATPLAGTEGAVGPFFSPDGQWIGFTADQKLKKVSVSGGAAITLCDRGPSSLSGSWAEDGNIFFNKPTIGPLAGSDTGLLKVRSEGGKLEPLTTLDKGAGETQHAWPQALQGGKAVLYTARAGRGPWEDASIIAQALPAGPRKVVHRGGFHARYLPSGHLVYMHRVTLFAAPFDPEKLEMTGSPVPVLESVLTDSLTGGAQFAFANDGTAVYSPGSDPSGGLSLLWLDREGKTEPLRSVPARYSFLRFSPDGTRLAMVIGEGLPKSDVWVYEWERDTLSRLTSEPGQNVFPVWTPDGRRISYTNDPGTGAMNIFWKRADGTGEAQRLTEGNTRQSAGSWHPGGKMLAFYEGTESVRSDIMILPMDGDEATGWKPGKPTPFMTTPFSSEITPAFSPDGRWLAYSSNETGQFEIYVRPFPGPGGKWQISSGGGSTPTWSLAAKELLYWSGPKIMVCPYTVAGDSFRAERPRAWTEAPIDIVGPRLALHPDGKRVAVAVLKAPEQQAEVKRDKVFLITNFFDELRRLAPPKR